MTKSTKLQVAIAAFVVASPAFATPAPYTLTLTSVGDGANNGSVYFDPYTGTIVDNFTHQQIYSGYLICDDYGDESVVGGVWGATETDAGNLNGTELFKGNSTVTVNGTSTTYSAQQRYDAVSWLANQLVPGNATNENINDPNGQGNLSFAIWDIMDGHSANGLVADDITAAFDAALDPNHPYVGSNVEVYTPVGDRPHPQEFLVVNGPSVPEPSSVWLCGLGMMALLGWCAVSRARYSNSLLSERSRT